MADSSIDRVFVLGADPSARQAGTGWAFVVAPARHGPIELLLAGKVEPNGYEIARVIERASAVACQRSGGPARVTLAIEAQFVSRPNQLGARVGAVLSPEADRAIQGRASSAVATAAARGRWLGLVEALRWPVVELLPAQWRATLSLPPRAKREECKRAARQSVELRLGDRLKAIKVRLSGDVAEAILIAEYQARVEQLSALGG